MDTFIDKLAQKKNAQEMIRANSAAEAAKMDQMQKQMKAYDELMQEIRRVNIKTAENVDNVRDLLAQCMEKLESLEKESGQAEDVEKQLAGIKSLLEERLTQSEEFMHSENVKVYRNVQAVVVDETKRQAEEAQTQYQKLDKKVNRVMIFSILSMAASIISILLMIINMLNIKLF